MTLIIRDVVALDSLSPPNVTRGATAVCIVYNAKTIVAAAVCAFVILIARDTDVLEEQNAAIAAVAYAMTE